MKPLQQTWVSSIQHEQVSSQHYSLDQKTAGYGNQAWWDSCKCEIGSG